MKIKNIILLFLLSGIFIACNQKQTADKLDFGKYEGNKYINEFFDLELTLPEEWEVLSKEENIRLMANSNQLLADEINEKNESLDAAKYKTVILVVTSPARLDGTDDEFNANLMLLAENIENDKQIKTANEYLLNTKKTLESNATPKEYPYKSLKKQMIGETEWLNLRVISKPVRLQYTQDYFTILKNGYAVTAILTYNSEQQKEQLMSCLNTLLVK